MSMHTETCRTNCHIDHALVTMEQSIIRYTIRRLQAVGYRPSQVWAAGEYITVRSVKETIEVTDSVDESVIYLVNDRTKQTVWLDIIRGNGTDVIGHEWSANLNDDLMMDIYDTVERKYAR